MSNSLESRVLYQDNHLLILNKSAGELVQGDKTGDKTLAMTAQDYLKQKFSKPGDAFIGIPHRLDRPVSGIVIYAKTSKGLSRMTNLFRVKEIEKTYWAVVEKAPEVKSGTLNNYMIKNEKQNKSYVSEIEKPGHKQAILHYTLLSSSDKYHLIEVKLETGRHHQIRGQLAHMGCIIKGDLKYGASRSNKDGSIHLHSRACKFIHPIKESEVNVVAPCPDDALWKFFEKTV